jgi:hypothetical protein
VLAVGFRELGEAEYGLMESRVLGPQEAVGSRGPVELRGTRRQALVEVLVFPRRKVSSPARLSEELWTDESQGPEPSVQTGVHQLRDVPEADRGPSG